MRRIIRLGDITLAKADALVYSTNTMCLLTGGVGAALSRKYGPKLQVGLRSQLTASKRTQASSGDVFEFSLPDMPWKTVFHTVATDAKYHSDPASVKEILRKCAARCCERGDITSMAISPLGTGHSDLEVATFIDLATEVFFDPAFNAIEEVAIHCLIRSVFAECGDRVAKAGYGWIMEGPAAPAAGAAPTPAPA